MTRYHYLKDFNTQIRYSVKLTQTGYYAQTETERIAYTVRETGPNGKKLLKSRDDYHVPVSWKPSERVDREGAKFVLMSAVDNFEMEII